MTPLTDEEIEKFSNRANADKTAVQNFLKEVHKFSCLGEALIALEKYIEKNHCNTETVRAIEKGIWHSAELCKWGVE